MPNFAYTVVSVENILTAVFKWNSKKFLLKDLPFISNDEGVKGQILSNLLVWFEKRFPFVCVLNSNAETSRTGKNVNYDLIVAAGGVNGQNKILNTFDQLRAFIDEVTDKTGTVDFNLPGIFGFLSYDLKNQTEQLNSDNADGINMPLMHFFVPQYLFILRKDKLWIHSKDKMVPDIIKQLFKEKSKALSKPKSNISLKGRVTKKEYISTVNKIKEHIQRGDIYELNFCQEFYAENTEIDPVATYIRLNEFSSMPFSCFYKLDDKYLLCSSPERFLAKKGKKVLSQPIKGTIKRGVNEEEDRMLINKLRRDKKEQSENVMIVDLVRNDLSRFAKKGSVKVDELFGIYTFSALHQMISTISCEMDENSGKKGSRHIVDAIKYCFPMGSMTGAPKVKAMELIEKYESTKRGLFSGSVGYFTAGGDFDFNVVIRSILFNKKNKYVSVMVGSAITAGSIAGKEYEECLLKALPMKKALNAG